jgi:hypothetical protein
MSDSFEVSFRLDPALNGRYVVGSRAGVYLQQNGKHILTQHTTGQWGIGDGVHYIILARLQGGNPEGRSDWQFLQNNRYYNVDSVSITRVGAAAPAAAEKKGDQHLTHVLVTSPPDP